jgi:hypothetical protein
MASVPYQKTPVTPTQMKAALQQVFPTWSDRALAVPGAMWHLETGGGTSEFNWNPAGVTGSYNGMSVTPPHMTLTFRAYPDIVSGAIDWLNVLKYGYPGSLQAASIGDLAGFTMAVGPAKYCGCDAAAYTAGLKARYQQWLASTPPGPVALQILPNAVPRDWTQIAAVGALGVAGLAWWYLLAPKSDRAKVKRYL